MRKGRLTIIEKKNKNTMTTSKLGVLTPFMWVSNLLPLSINTIDDKFL